MNLERLEQLLDAALSQPIVPFQGIDAPLRELRRERLTIRVTKMEKEWVLAQCQGCKKSESDYLRSRIFTSVSSKQSASVMNQVGELYQRIYQEFFPLYQEVREQVYAQSLQQSATAIDSMLTAQRLERCVYLLEQILSEIVVGLARELDASDESVSQLIE